jgi:hypothetical protein
MRLRAATMQFGYFIGSIAAGAALAFGGYTAFGVTMGLLFGAAAATTGGRRAAQPTRGRVKRTGTPELGRALR